LSESVGGGCSRKLDASSLRELLRDSGGGDARADPVDSGWRDAEEFRFPSATESTVVSADALYAFGVDAVTFGAIAATHALSDLYATLSEPVFGTVTLGVNRSAVTSGRAAGVLRGIRNAMSDAGARLAGGHTLIAHDIFAALTVVGGTPRIRPAGKVAPGDALVLSKPLGTGLALSAMRFGILAPDDLAEAEATMLRSNREAADWLVGAAGEGVDPLVRAVTDVSGFGFLHALRTILSGGRVQIDAPALPMLRGVARWVDDQAWSSLLDANLADSLGHTTYSTPDQTALLQAVLNDPQTSGGLLAVIDPRAVEDDALADSCFVSIGCVTSVTGPLQLTVS
jgi:selenide,water dikinase